MVTFDHALPGTHESEWVTETRLHDRPALQSSLRLTQAEELIVVAAHPDDETLGAGGLIAHFVALGLPVRVICVTDGAASHPGDAQIIARRTQELRDAVQSLGSDVTVEMLGFADGKTLEQRPQIEIALNKVLSATSPSAVVAVPWRGDGHRDHRIVAEVVAEVTAALPGDRLLLEYPIWMWHWGHPSHPDIPWERMVSLDIDAQAKSAAISFFRSQLDGDVPMLRSDFIDHFLRNQEVFITSEKSLTQDYFDVIYAHSDDPWRFRSRWYEQRKRLITLASLPHERYNHGLEIGCSIGILTELLASRCEELLALDISPEAVEQARGLLGTRATIETQDVLKDFPTGTFDLVVLSEVGYYWSMLDLREVLNNIAANLTPDGVIVACHWRYPVEDYLLTGDQVHSALNEQHWHRLAQHIEEDFILEVFSNDPRSVAKQEGF